MAARRRTDPERPPATYASGERRRVSAPLPASPADDEPVDLPRDLQARILDLHARLDVLTFYELLGVPRGADKRDIKRAYNARAAELHTDRFFRKRLGTYKRKMEAIFARMTEAHDTLCSESRRADYDVALGARRASMVQALLEEAEAEMSGSSEAARREEVQLDEFDSAAPDLDAKPRR